MIQINKTARFLKPLLRLYGKPFTDKLAKVYKLGYGIGDLYLNQKYKEHIFILVDTIRCKKFFNEFLDFIQLQNYYEDDYSVDNLFHGRLHMFVIRLPESCKGKLQNFIKGRYSKMYSKDEAEEFLEDTEKKIVLKMKDYRIHFVQKVNEYFQSILREEELHPDAELELPPNIDQQEFFENISVPIEEWKTIKML